MADVHQEVRIKWGINTPRLKGKLRPIIRAPIGTYVKPVIKENLPVYIDPLPVKPIILKAIEPPIKELIKPVIPEYIGEPDGQQKSIREEPDKVPATDQSGETLTDDEDTPRTL